MSAQRKFSSSFTTTSPNQIPRIDSTNLIAQSSLKICLDCLIGEGATSRVYIGKYQEKDVAVKHFIMDNPKLPHNRNLLLKEAAQLLDLDHLHIVKCYGVCTEYGSLVLELTMKQIEIDEECFNIHSLRQLIETARDQFPVQLKNEALYHIACGLDYLHQRKLTHGDLKSGNVLVTGQSPGQFIFKLCDLGQAHAVLRSKLATNITRSNSRMKAGTMSFEGPEVFHKGIKTAASDIYSYAMVIYELLFPLLNHPWADTIPSEGLWPQVVESRIADAVKRGDRPTIPSSHNSPHINIMQNCWAQEPENRPTAEQLKVLIEKLQEDVHVDRSPGTASSLQVEEQSPLISAIKSKNTRVPECIAVKKKLNFSNEDFSRRMKKPEENAAAYSDLEEFSSCRDSMDDSDVSNTDETARPISPPQRTPLSNKTSSNVLLKKSSNRSRKVAESGKALKRKRLNYSDGSESQTELINSNVIEQQDTTVNSFSSHPNEKAQIQEQSIDDLGEPQVERIMIWSGYAGTRLKIALAPFQIRALLAFESKRNCIVIQATGSGKSTCFQIPAMMLKPGQYGIVIVPTVALGEDHLHCFQSLKIIAIFLSSNAKKVDYDNAFYTIIPDERRPSIIILTPESLLGNDSRKGIVDLVHRNRLQFIAVDEAHLIFEWADFREAYKKMENPKNIFDCPIMALSATLKPSSLRRMQSEILRNPVIIQGSIDRKNVAIHFAPYKLLNNNSADENSTGKNPWFPVAKQIQNIVDGKKSIVYCAYANDCEKLSIMLSQLGMKSWCYTGKQTSAKDKVEIYSSMKEGNIDVLVATKAFGMGVNLPDVRHIVHVGIPENLSLWVQEFGRAGRDGQQAHATLLICEFQDMKKLSFLTKDCTPEERTTRIDDYIEVWKYIATAFTGNCLRQYHLKYFEDESIPKENCSPILCCTGCVVKQEVPFKEVAEIVPTLKCIDILNIKGMQRVYECKIVDWIYGPEQGWLWTYFDKKDLKENESFGCLSSMTKSEAEICVKGILRQCLSPKYLSLDFNVLPSNSSIIVKVWNLTKIGHDVIEGTIKPPYLPDPVKVTNFLLTVRNEEKEETKKTRSRSKKGVDIVSRTILLMKDETCWEPLVKREQYEMLGFKHDTCKLLYVEDYSKLNCCPAKEHGHYMWKDIGLSKGSSFKELSFGLEKDHHENPKFILKRCHCSGVKVCEGGSLEEPCKCEFFVYVSPIDIEDKRRWLGFLSQSTSKAIHNHPIPCPSKLGSKLKEDIEKAVQLDPTKTADDISKGYGLGYSPASFNIAAANKGSLSHLVNRFRIDLTGASSQVIIKDFDRLVKKKVDEQESKQAESEEADQEILDLCTPYIRDSTFGDSISTVVLATPQILAVMTEAIFLEADVTYPGTLAFPYLLNIIAYNALTMQFQAVARALMTKLTSAAYKIAFEKIFEITRNIHPEFAHGAAVKAWIVDFSSAQHTGLADYIGDRASELIRGCEVHYLRMTKKVADKVASTDKQSKDLFMKIASIIPRLQSKEDVALAFDVLHGAEELELATKFISLSEVELGVNTAKWSGAIKWATWWEKPKIIKMFTKAFKDMSDADWEVCPRTTNAAESHNKLSKARTVHFVSAMENYYRVDKRSCYQTKAAELGVSVGISDEKRLRMNAKRKSRRLRARLIEENLSEVEDCELEPTSNVEKDSIQQCAAEPTSEVISTNPNEEIIGRRVWIDKNGSDGTYFGWCEATIKKKNRKCHFIAVYAKWPKHFTTIPDIYDESEVRFYSPVPQ